MARRRRAANELQERNAAHSQNCSIPWCAAPWWPGAASSLPFVVLCLCLQLPAGLQSSGSATRGREVAAAGHCELVKHPLPPPPPHTHHQLGTSRCLWGGEGGKEGGGTASLCSLLSREMSWKMRGGGATPPSQDPVHSEVPPTLSLNTAAAF